VAVKRRIEYSTLGWRAIPKKRRRIEYLGILEGRYKATWKREFNLPWREAGPPNHHDDKVDSDQ